MTTAKKQTQKFVLMDPYGDAIAVGFEDRIKDALDDIVQYDGPEGAEGFKVYELGTQRGINIETTITF
jgi:hypothetical protein